MIANAARLVGRQLSAEEGGDGVLVEVHARAICKHHTLEGSLPHAHLASVQWQLEAPLAAGAA